MKPDDIILYSQLVKEEGSNLQRGMNYGVTPSYSVFLMSIRPGAPYRDKIDKKTGIIIYEGHDVERRAGVNPKAHDQPLATKTGKWTENGKFFRAAVDYKSGFLKKAHIVKIYEKITKGKWCFKGLFELIDAAYISDGHRKVFNFHLHPIRKTVLRGRQDVPVRRLIPSQIKVQVWNRDRGRCVLCGAKENLHYDHDIPFSRGGSSIVAENVRLLCAKHNLSKSNKILSAAALAQLGLDLNCHFYN
jgi:hypothetical protein